MVLDFIFEIEGKSKAIKSDNGSEFTSHVMMKWVSDHEIIHRFSLNRELPVRMQSAKVSTVNLEMNV